MSKTKDDSKGNFIINTVQMARHFLASHLGEYNNKKHNIWGSAGYPVCISFDDYWKMYKRGGIAKRTIDAFISGTWMNDPIIKESGENESSAFENSIKEMDENLELFNVLKRFDTISGIGEYGGLLLGFDDNVVESSKVTRANELIFIRALPQKFMCINTYNNDTSSERFGKPETYQVTIAEENGTSKNMVVHWSRIIHLSWELLESDTIGLPALEVIYNYLLDLEKFLAASGEGYWKTAYPGLSVVAKDDAAQIDDDTKKDMKEQLTEYEENMRRFLTMQGVDIKELKSVNQSPDKQVDSLISLISGAKGIPKRILIGNEQGELASSQDESSWNKTLTGRQNNYATPKIIKAFVNRLISVGVLPSVDYTVYWPDIHAPSEKEVLENQKILVDLINTYLSGDAATLWPFELFLEEVLKYDQESIKQIMTKYKQIIKDEENDIEENEDDDE